MGGILSDGYECDVGTMIACMEALGAMGYAIEGRPEDETKRDQAHACTAASSASEWRALLQGSPGEAVLIDCCRGDDESWDMGMRALVGADGEVQLDLCGNEPYVADLLIAGGCARADKPDHSRGWWMVFCGPEGRSREMGAALLEMCVWHRRDKWAPTCPDGRFFNYAVRMGRGFCLYTGEVVRDGRMVSWVAADRRIRYAFLGLSRRIERELTSRLSGMGFWLVHPAQGR